MPGNAGHTLTPTRTGACDWPERALEAKRQDWLGFWLVVAVSVALHFELARPLFEGKLYTYDDLTRFHLPMRDFYARCLARGWDFYWNPEIYCGFFLQAEGQAGMLHPWHLALYRLLPLSVAFMLELVFSYQAIQVGMYVWLRGWGLGRAAAAFGSLSLAFSSTLMLKHVHINATATFAHVPWMLWCLERLVREPGKRWLWAPLLALLTASQLLIGYPQYVYYGLLVELAHALVLWRVGMGVLPLGLGVLAKGLGAVAASCQLLPFLGEVARSVRGEVITSFGITRPEHFVNLIQLVGPYLFRARGYFPGEPAALGQVTHEATLYLGSATPVLLIALMFLGRLPRQLSLLARGMAGLSAIGLLLTFIEATPLVDLYRQVPVIRLFRVSARYFILVQFATAVLAAIAFERLLHGPPRRDARVWLVGLAPAAGLVCACWAGVRWMGGDLELSRLLAPAECVAAGVLLTGAAAGCVFAAARGWRFGLWALVILAAADLGTYGLTFIRVFPIRSLEQIVSALPRRPIPNAGQRILMRGLPIESATDIMTLTGEKLAGGYAGLIPRLVLDENSNEFERLAGVGFSLELATVSGRPVRWSVVAGPLPRVRMVARARVSRDPRLDVSTIDLEREALVAIDAALEDGPPGKADIERDEPGLIRVRTDAKTAQLLVVSERHNPGWVARTDGEARPVLACNGDFMGVRVPAGTHDVELRFQPWSVRVGSWLSLLSVCLILAWSATLRWAGPRGRREGVEGAHEPMGR